MSSAWLVSLLITGAASVFFFAFYFRKFRFDRRFLFWQMQSFAFGILAATASIVAQGFMPGLKGVWFFWAAAGIEELIKGIFWFIRHNKIAGDYHPTRGLFDFMVIGLGFAFAENIYHSFDSSPLLILWRCVSSIPIHVYCGVLFGYYVSHGKLIYNPINRLAFYGVGLWLAFLVHGSYNVLLVTGGKYLLLIPVILLVVFFWGESRIRMTSQSFGKQVLDVLDMDHLSFQILFKAKNFERWMFDFQKARLELPSLFQKKIHRFDIRAAWFFAALSLVSLAVFTLVPGRWFIKSGPSLLFQQALTVELFAMLAFVFWAKDFFNFRFIQEILFRIPKFQAVQFHSPAEAKFREGFVLSTALTGIYLIGSEDLQDGPVRCKVTTQRGRELLQFSGRVTWQNDHNDNYPFGSIILTHPLDLKFALFHIQFQLRLYLKRLVFFLKLPLNVIKSGHKKQ